MSPNGKSTEGVCQQTGVTQLLWKEHLCEWDDSALLDLTTKKKAQKGFQFETHLSNVITSHGPLIFISVAGSRLID